MDTIRLLKTIHKHTHTSPSAAPKKKNKSCVFQFSGQDLPERPSSSGYEEHRGYTLKKGLETKRVMHHLGLFLNPITITDVHDCTSATGENSNRLCKAALVHGYSVK